MVSITAPAPRPAGGPSALKKLKVQNPSPLPLTPPSSNAGVLRKRGSSQAGMDIDSSPSLLESPSIKRSKVHFDSDVEVVTPSEAGGPIDLLHEEVSRALDRHLKSGDSKEYLAIKSMFLDGAIPDGTLGLPPRRQLLRALMRVPLLLEKSCSDLVDAILNSDWTVRDTDYTDTFSRFVVYLVSARSAWIGMVLQMLVAKFARPMPAAAAQAASVNMPARKEIHQRIHRIIAQIIKISPLDGPMSLRRALSKLYPSSWDSTKAHILYVHNLLKVTEYAPQLEAEVLAIATDRIVKIDVQVQTDIEDLDDLDEVLIGDAPEALDAFMDSLDDDEDDEDEDEEGGEDSQKTDTDLALGSMSEERARSIKKDIQKMDMLLDMIFNHYYHALNTSEARRTALYGMLQSQFHSVVLPAYHSRHTQFLVFHFAQTDDDFIDEFVGDCLDRVMDRARSALVRRSAASYLASFIARGAHVPAQIVRNVFAYVGDELSKMREEYEPRCTGPDLRRFSTYYSLVQALLYIFCFRWRDLTLTPSDPGASPEPYNSATAIAPYERTGPQYVFVPKVKETLARNCYSKLNPLKICSPSIAEEFARVANATGAAFVLHIIETNKRIVLTNSSAGVGAAGSTAASMLDRGSALSVRRDQAALQLDGYFPFDPYHLPRSRRWLAGDYREWEGPPGSDEEDEGAMESNSEEDDDDDDDEEDDSDEDSSDDEN